MLEKQLKLGWDLHNPRARGLRQFQEEERLISDLGLEVHIKGLEELDIPDSKEIKKDYQGNIKKNQEPT